MDTERLVSFPFGMASWQVGAVSLMEDTGYICFIAFFAEGICLASYFRKVGSFTLRHKGSLKQPNNDPTNQDLILHTFFFWGDILGISTMVNHHHLSPPLGRRCSELFPTTLGKSKHITGLVKPNSTLVSATFEADDFVRKKRSPSKIVSLKRPLWKCGTSHGKILKGKDESPVHFGYFHRSLSTAMSQSLMFHAHGWSFWNMGPEFQRAVPVFLFEHVDAQRSIAGATASSYLSSQ